MTTKKKGLHSDLIRSVFFPGFLPKFQRGGVMAQFCVLFLANCTLLATRKGWPWHNDPSNTPLDNFLCLLFKNILSKKKKLKCWNLKLCLCWAILCNTSMAPDLYKMGKALFKSIFEKMVKFWD